ncbi:MAG: DUF4157 domain-containing protein [Chloroflexi bacterium]|nr:DUF4157 domain-containing protein [Chloroflexota bacterium]
MRNQRARIQLGRDEAESRVRTKAERRDSDNAQIAEKLRSDYSSSAFEQHVAAVSRSAGSSQGAQVMRKLQQGYGNAYAQRVVQRLRQERIQAKLTVGPAGDMYEQEADKVAKQVVGDVQRQSPEEEELQMKRLQRQAEEDELMMKPLQRQSPEEEELQMKRLQRQSEEDELMMKRLQRQSLEEDEMMMKRLQRQAVVGAEGGDLDSELAGVIDGARGKGQPLPDNLRAGMEQSFGTDFSNVRVHTDAKADALNGAVSAHAFTTGSDIFVRRSDYNPGSRSGQELLAHELTHVVQQGAAVQREADESR